MNILLTCIGEISDMFIEEAELADISLKAVTRKKIAKYSAMAAAASVGIAVTYWFIKSKKAVA